MAMDYIKNTNSALSNLKSMQFTYYFFQSDREYKNRTAEDIVRVILKLLCSDIRPLAPKVKNLYRDGWRRIPLEYSKFVDTFVDCAVELSAIVFFDALYECSEEKCEQIIQLMKRFV